MNCEIVKAWVGHMDNTYYYCRKHKVECNTDKSCPNNTPISDNSPTTYNEIVREPSIDDYALGQKIRCISYPPNGLYFIGSLYLISTVDRTANTLFIKDARGLVWPISLKSSLTFFKLDLDYITGIAAGVPIKTKFHAGSLAGQLQTIKCHSWVSDPSSPQFSRVCAICGCSETRLTATAPCP